MFKSSTFKRLLLVWPLLFGIGMLMVSSGLQGTLLGLRANHEQFPVYITGIIMAMYYCGFLIGCRVVPNMIASVGHIRVFAALASLASTTVLMHGLYVYPLVWVAVRLLTGFCFSGLFIIAESWLSKISNNEQRGKIFSAYVFVVYGGLFIGQFLINLAPITSIDLFILVSILISVALAPISLTNTHTPKYQKPEGISFSLVMKTSPLAMTGVFVAGLCSSSMLSLGPVYAGMRGMETSNVALLMGVYILGNAVMPLIFGSLSDRMDRRKVIIGISGLAIVCAVAFSFFTDFYPAIFLLGGCITSLYSVSITHMQDQIRKSQIVSASRSLILFNSIGSSIGPVLGGFMLSFFGTHIFFGLLGFYMIVVLCIAYYRSIKGNVIDESRKKKFTHLPSVSAPTVVSLNIEKPDDGAQSHQDGSISGSETK